MKKQVAKITLKTARVVALSKAQARNVAGGRRPTESQCTTNFCQI